MYVLRKSKRKTPNDHVNVLKCCCLSCVLQGIMDCHKEKCFNWIDPGANGEMEGKDHNTLLEALRRGLSNRCPQGGCCCQWGKCIRQDPEGDGDYYMPYEKI